VLYDMEISFYAVNQWIPAMAYRSQYRIPGSVRKQEWRNWR